MSPLGNPISVVYGSATTTAGSPPVTTACAPASGSEFAVGATAVTCTATDTLQRTAACTFTVTVSAPSRLSVTSFVAFGDSMTEGEVTDALSPTFLRVLEFDKAYPFRLQLELLARYTAQPGIQVTNKGLQGESVTSTGLTGMTAPDRLRLVLSGAPYQVLLLMEGANDINSRDSKTIPPTVAGMQTMVRYAKGLGLKVFLATLPPENPRGSLGTGAILVQPYNDALKAMAAMEDVPIADVYAAFGGDTTTLIGSDGLHPTVAGYQKIADTFFDAIKARLELAPVTTAVRRPVLTRLAPRR